MLRLTVRQGHDLLSLGAAAIILSTCTSLGPSSESNCASPGNAGLNVPASSKAAGGQGGQATTGAPGPTAATAGGAQPSPPHVVGGRIILTEAQDGQTITVPAGTIVEVDLVTKSYGPWSIPASSDPQALPRLSGSAACDGTSQATFRADGSGQITASRGNREVTQKFSVSIAVAA